jgi:peptide/nickel transport system ATP-binding protein
MSTPLLSIQDLKVAFRTGKQAGVVQRAQAVKGIRFDIPANATVALVGESGSGKSVTAMSILNLLPENAEREGAILFQGQDLLKMSLRQLQGVRGKDIACVFQDPMSSLNPVFTIAQQLMEPLVKHLGMTPRQALARAEELLGEVGIPEPKRRLHAYPHEMSGGQQQRVMIAMALSCEPKLLIADEPTTALDVTIQRQVLELMGKLKTSRQMSMLFISHDLGVVGEIADAVVVMRHGEIREQADVATIFRSPQDAYTKALLACRPSLSENPARLMVIDDHIAGRQARQVGKAKDPHAPILLEVKGLKKSFWFKEGLFGKKEFPAVKGVSFQLRKGHTLGVVGESGSGKTTMGLTLLRLHEPSGGEALFEGRDLLKLSGPDWQAMRRRIQVVFQNPYASPEPALQHPADPARTDADPRHRQGRRRAPGARHRAPEEGRAGRVGAGQVSARVQWRSASAHRHRALPDARPRGAGARRGGVGARRLGAGPGAQSAQGPAGRAGPLVHLHQPRPGGGALHQRRGAGDAAGRCGRAGARRDPAGQSAAGLHEAIAGRGTARLPGGLNAA